LGVNVGDAVIWNPRTRRIGSLICGKAIDDRAGLAVMTELLKQLDVAKLQYDLYFASTVQEEMGLLGATSLGRKVAFDLAIAIDVGLSGDIPLVDEKEMPVRLSAGPILVYHDYGVDYDRRLTRALSEVAREANIPVQHAVFQRYSSDGKELTKLGIRTALVAFPARYTHSPFETVHERDLIQTVELLHKFLQSEFIV
jgi:endoglucanase